MPAERQQQALVRTAALAAGVIIAQQTASKATRDALFLSNFDVSWLPSMLVVASLLSIAMVFVATHLMRSYGPAKLMPAAFAVSVVLLLANWAISLSSPAASGVILYLHVAALGAVLISGFWSVVTERFDPRTARQAMGRVAGGATLGGLLGGVLAERLAALVGVAWMLPTLAAMHAYCAYSVWHLIHRDGREAATVRDAGGDDDGPRASSAQILRRSTHLRNLALMLFVVNVMATLLDYAFKERAAATVGDGDALLRFFALFYTVVGVLTFGVQSALSRVSLERLGLAGTVSTMPGAVLLFGAGAFVAPGLAAATLTRGSETVLRSSLFRSGYELFYTPIPTDQKRATKTLIDVGFDRAGDITGSLLVMLVLWLLPGSSVQLVMTAAAIALAAYALHITRRLHQGYVESLERSLVDRAIALDIDDIADNATRQTIMSTMGGASLVDALRALRGRGTGASADGPPGHHVLASRAAMSLEFELPGALRERHAAPENRRPPKPSPAPTPEPPTVDVVLRSGDADAVLALLASEPAPGPEHAQSLAHLLSWDEVARPVAARLRAMAPDITDTLAERLLDPDEDFATRRRIPAILRYGEPKRAVEALVAAWRDRRFEVRYRAVRALSRILDTQPDATPPEDVVVEAVKRELNTNRRMWDTRQLLDSADDEDPLLEGLLDARQSRSLEHVFRMLALLPPRKPMRLAFRGLQTDDPMLRGTALEYIETALPYELTELLMPLIDAERAPATAKRDAADIRDELLRSQQSIRLNLEKLRAVMPPTDTRET